MLAVVLSNRETAVAISSAADLRHGLLGGEGTGGARGSLWARVRSFVRARAVVVYWLGLTEHLMAPGGAAEARDRMDYDMDFM